FNFTLENLVLFGIENLK
ncbi:unnamed protein product, partial [Rotaria socialis]